MVALQRLLEPYGICEVGIFLGCAPSYHIFTYIYLHERISIFISKNILKNDKFHKHPLSSFSTCSVIVQLLVAVGNSCRYSPY